MGIRSLLKAGAGGVDKAAVKSFGNPLFRTWAEPNVVRLPSLPGGIRLVVVLSDGRLSAEGD